MRSSTALMHESMPSLDTGALNGQSRQLQRHLTMDAQFGQERLVPQMMPEAGDSYEGSPQREEPYGLRLQREPPLAESEEAGPGTGPAFVSLNPEEQNLQDAQDGENSDDQMDEAANQAEMNGDVHRVSHLNGLVMAN